MGQENSNRIFFVKKSTQTLDLGGVPKLVPTYWKTRLGRITYVQGQVMKIYNLTAALTSKYHIQYWKTIKSIYLHTYCGFLQKYSFNSIKIFLRILITSIHVHILKLVVVIKIIISKNKFCVMTLENPITARI